MEGGVSRMSLKLVILKLSYNFKENIIANGSPCNINRIYFSPPYEALTKTFL